MNSTTPRLDRTKYSPTPAGICEAARAGDVRAIELLLAARPELLTVNNPHNWTKTAARHEVRGSYNKKPVEVAAFFNQPQAVTALLENARHAHAIGKPWDDHLPFDGHFNALGIAIALQHAQVIMAIEADVMTRLELRPKLINESDIDGRTVLSYASEQGSLSLVRKLLLLGADPDHEQPSGRRVIYSVLCSSAVEQRRETARLLIEHGVEINLWIATALDDIESVKAFLESDSTLANRHFFPYSRRLSEGFPLVRACANGNQAMVELLLQHGANVNAENSVEDAPEFGMPLIAAIYAKHYEIANLLLDHGASVHAHPNCAAPLVDMLYYAAVEESPDWLALGELAYTTDDPRTHLQPNHAGSPSVVQLYQRVVAQGASPQLYSRVKMNEYAEIERQLKNEPERIATNPGENGTTFNSLAHAAAWLGDVQTMELCLTLHPVLHSPKSANSHINAAVRSHNRDGQFADYRRIIEMNLQYLRDQNAQLTLQPLCLLAEDFLENYSYGTNPDLPTMSDLLDLADLFLNFGHDIDQRNPESGHTALSMAVQQGHVEYVAFLLDRVRRSTKTIHRKRIPCCWRECMASRKYWRC